MGQLSSKPQHHHQIPARIDDVRCNTTWVHDVNVYVMVAPTKPHLFIHQDPEYMYWSDDGETSFFDLQGCLTTMESSSLGDFPRNPTLLCYNPLTGVYDNECVEVPHFENISDTLAHRNQYYFVNEMALSADMSEIAIATPIGTLIVDAKSMERKTELKTYETVHLAYSPDGKYLAVISRYQYYCLQLFTLPGYSLITDTGRHNDCRGETIVFSPRCDILAVSLGVSCIEIRNIPALEVIYCLKCPVRYSRPGAVSLFLSPTLLVAPQIGSINVWNLETRKIVKKLKVGIFVTHLANSPDSRTFACNDSISSVGIYDSTKFKLVKRITCKISNVRTICYMDSETVLIFDQESILRVNIDTGNIITSTPTCPNRSPLFKCRFIRIIVAGEPIVIIMIELRI